MRPPRTSYGYLAPPGAVVDGWHCYQEDCGAGDSFAPRSWPHPCRECGQPTDPSFAEPWAHDAWGYRLRYRISGPDRSLQAYAEIELPTWEYRDARRKGDERAAEAAWQAYLSVRRSLDARWTVVNTKIIISCAAEHDDLDPAAEEILEIYPTVDTSYSENDGINRDHSLQFLSLCIDVLSREASIGHPREQALLAAMRDVANRVESELMDNHKQGFQRVAEMRAMRRAQAAITEERQSLDSLYDDLPTATALPRDHLRELDPDRDVLGAFGVKPWLALRMADAVIEAARIHGDMQPLDALIARLDELGAAAGLARFLRAHRLAVSGDLPGAMAQLESALKVPDPFRRLLRPQIYATQGLLRVRMDPAALDDGIALCRRGRERGLAWWRRSTPADTGLVRLLLWRARNLDVRSAARQSDIDDAIRLIRRRCRAWHAHGVQELLLRHEALAARDELTGGGNLNARHKSWADLVDRGKTTTVRARLAAAWAQWAVSVGEPLAAADAYRCLVESVAQDSASRRTDDAKQRVLAAAQEYAEDAGYWLARAGQYREAVLALETGRAVGLTEALGRDGDGVERLRYEDIIAETGDGPLVYLAAAKAGGYALIVAADHDPQFVDLPKLDRASIAALAEALIPRSPSGAGVVRGSADEDAKARDILMTGRCPDPVLSALYEVWHTGINAVVLWHARAQIVTLIPIGLLSLLPVHAAGEVEAPRPTDLWPRYAGHFAALRYAPNVRTLRRCRETVRELAGRGDALLAVDVPDGFGVDAAARLRHVSWETQEAVRRWTRGPASRPLHDCTWAEFRAAADDYGVWHLACHGSADPHAIMDTRLYFADRQVSLGELKTALRPGRRRLAVLSACETNLTDSNVPNEVVGLPSALIEVGFAGVVAAAWRVDDLATAYLMTAFYHFWRADGDEPPVALNRAQAWLRAATRGELEELIPGVRPQGDPGERPYPDPRYWAAFAYTGA